ncbi:CK1 family protein kinase [Histomonas meleagridis]|uniref:CK1 family protein kinase n=1 Tax=Histomonas meleagridis TaxID=135588 RepID=UPI00355AAA7B|nr:CK1 family protein kinase [Histomonas meleagridis]KAH0806192.1 CK1 family protein kinase [Histomonas meleagridis]
MEITVGGHFKLHRKIGSGSFGEVYSGEDTKTHQIVAIKLEPNKTNSPQLTYESKLYLIFSGGVSIPKLHWYGNEANYRVMVIDYLGKSLEDLFQLCHQRFSLKTVLMIADQCISAIQYIHNKSFIHRDIKPDNFLIGVGNKKSQIYCIDFGLSKKYRDPKTHQHIKFVQGKSLTGTARYASINALGGCEQSRRDDMEALGYCFLYFLRGSLPWMGLDAKNRKEKYERICCVKASTSLEDLCDGLPHEFLQYMQLVHELNFTDEPEYARYRQLFRDCFIREGFVYDYQYDWVEIIQNTEPGHPKRTDGLHPLVAMKGNCGSRPSLIVNVNDSQNEETVNDQKDDKPPTQQIPKVTSEIPSQPFSSRIVPKPNNNNQRQRNVANSKNPLMRTRTTNGQTVHKAPIPTGWTPPKRTPRKQ